MELKIPPVWNSPHDEVPDFKSRAVVVTIPPPVPRFPETAYLAEIINSGQKLIFLPDATSRLSSYVGTRVLHSIREGTVRLTPL